MTTTQTKKEACWSKRREEQLTKLWNDTTMSASGIASEMGGFSHCEDGGKSAIIGKVHRLKLKARKVGSGNPLFQSERTFYRNKKLLGDQVVRPLHLGLPKETRSNLSVLSENSGRTRQSVPKVSVCSRPVDDYPPGHKLSPFPLEQELSHDPNSPTLADIRFIEKHLYQ